MQKILEMEQVEEQKRFSYWRDMICDVFVQLDASQLSRQTFTGRMKVGSLNDIQISEVWADPQLVVRSNHQIQKSREDYFLVSLQTAGQGYIEQDQRKAGLQPSDFVLYDSTRPYRLHFEQPFQQIVFQFPRSLLLARCGEAEQMTSVLIPGTQHPVSSMVSTLLRTVASSYLHLDSITQLRVAETTLDLLATTLSTISGVKLNEVHSMANLYRARARVFISAHLANSNLTPSLVAASQGISTRYLHKLFEAEGQSVATFIREQRLKQCRLDFGDPKQIQYTVMDIAFKWGFNDAAHFSRVFKRRFGVNPAEYRNAALSTPRENKQS
ncbi:helix-turn-helix domain-containing protein [Priestia filamentosa]|uniref:AraC-like ligand-binding domain-containing protein n=1 Tax=Priestia filamentosa TaxID=1402861 RepID=UPI003857E5EF